MEKSKVYFTNFRSVSGRSVLDKLEHLVRKAGMLDKIDFNKKLTAIKIHFGEPGNLSYIRPNYAARIVRLIQQSGGLPFLTDANTLYKGRRANAVDHLAAAFENGFNPISVGCNVIIADGVKGKEYREIVIDKKHCKTAKIGSAVADADILISLNHFKGHELTGFGGCLKNIGMGCGSVGGKLEMHSMSQPVVSRENCVGCKKCVQNCAHDAIHLDGEKRAYIEYNKCVGCGQCIAMCQYNAVRVNWDGGSVVVNEKIAEYTYAVLKDKPSFHINFIMDVSPECDCWGANDVAIVPNIGICASFDPIAVDQASVDMVNAAPVYRGSVISDKVQHSHGEGEDKFKYAHPDTDWASGLSYAEELGLGTRSYELVTIE